ncbi:MAG: glucosaminidase domain-containing protein [Ktedonobacteraceae bacterium]|nr:glucosaminidase domain-containing protein [Ktedonobacteraceae bacterium]MBV9711968.1 glucosaminidase domain-containing protein [Ktedonobacteraceae bacterium]
MASGSYAKQRPPRPVEVQTRSVIPQRATRQLPEVALEEEESEASIFQSRLTRALSTGRTTKNIVAPPKLRKVVDEFAPHPLTRHRVWLNPVIICITVGVIFLVVMLWAGIAQRIGDPQLIDYTGGKAYSIQVGGSDAGSWQANTPLPPRTALPTQMGPYAVLGKPTVSANFIDRVLTSYHSPAAGKGQALYDMGVRYGIDPAFALAFFMHESSFGTAGEAAKTLSLGNLRCIPNFPCVDQDRGGYAAFSSWEAGFQAWYELIRNYYVAQRGLTTVDKIIPIYAPTADNNDEAAYIASLKHALDTWHAGMLMP